MKPFEINQLDHVAIRVVDLETSARWYEEALGLQRYDVEAWGPFPIFLLSGTTGIALFPANQEDPPFPESSRNVKIDHFAFNVDNENFEIAKKHYDELGLTYSVQDHTHFHSIYTLDPDGHTVELTTLVAGQESFYDLKK